MQSLAGTSKRREKLEWRRLQPARTATGLLFVSFHNLPYLFSRHNPPSENQIMEETRPCLVIFLRSSSKLLETCSCHHCLQVGLGENCVRASLLQMPSSFFFSSSLPNGGGTQVAAGWACTSEPEIRIDEMCNVCIATFHKAGNSAAWRLERQITPPPPPPLPPPRCAFGLAKTGKLKTQMSVE